METQPASPRGGFFCPCPSHSVRSRSGASRGLRSEGWNCLVPLHSGFDRLRGGLPRSGYRHGDRLRRPLPAIQGHSRHKGVIPHPFRFAARLSKGRRSNPRASRRGAGRRATWERRGGSRTSGSRPLCSSFVVRRGTSADPPAPPTSAISSSTAVTSSAMA